MAATGRPRRLRVAPISHWQLPQPEWPTAPPSPSWPHASELPRALATPVRLPEREPAFAARLASHAATRQLQTPCQPRAATNA